MTTENLWEDGYAAGERDALTWAAEIVDDVARQGGGLQTAASELRRISAQSPNALDVEWLTKRARDRHMSPPAESPPDTPIRPGQTASPTPPDRPAERAGEGSA